MKDAFYFSHDSNARSDIKIQALRSVYGTKGYGMYWIIIEMLRDSEGHKLPFNQKFAYLGFAKEFDCTAEEAKQFINDCIYDFSLFICDENHFWSDSLNRRMDKYKHKVSIKTENGMKGGRPRKETTETVVESILSENKDEHIQDKQKHVKTKNATVAHFHSDVEYLTDLLIEKIKQNNSNAKKPTNLDSWKKEIKSMIDIDKYTFEQVSRMIEFSQSDDFWKSNILSSKKLREKAGTLILQMQRTKKTKQEPESVVDTYNRLLKYVNGEDENEQSRNASIIDIDSIIV